MTLLQLFWSFLQVGMFSIGGGYAAMPLIRGQVVDQFGWLTMNEFTDLVTIAEMTPGPIAINAATFVGIRTAGVPGALAATFGCVLPSLILVSVLARLYDRFRNGKGFQTVLACLRPTIVALIAAAGISILQTALVVGEAVSWLGLLLFAAAFFVLRRFRWNPIAVMAACGAVGLIAGLIGKL